MPLLSRRSFVLAGSALPVLSLSCAAQAYTPNIVLYVIDDLGRSAVRDTPMRGLLRLAKQGVEFKTFWATPVCGPTRDAMLSGWYGPRIGSVDNETRGPILPHCGTTLASLMPDTSLTAVAGKWHHDFETPEQHGFERHCIWPRQAPAEWTGPATRRGRPSRYWHPCLVEDGALVPSRPDDFGPALLADWTARTVREANELGRSAVVLHNELLVHVDERGKLPPLRPGGGPATPRQVAHLCDRTILRLGRELARMTWPSLLIVTADNGSVDWGKLSLVKQRGPLVPMFVIPLGTDAWTLGIIPGRREQLASVVDLLPTVCEVMGAPHPGRDGVSMLPALLDPAAPGREWVYSWISGADWVMTEDGWLLDGRGHLFRRTTKGWRRTTHRAQMAQLAGIAAAARSITSSPAQAVLAPPRS